MLSSTPLDTQKELGWPCLTTQQEAITATAPGRLYCIQAKAGGQQSTSHSSASLSDKHVCMARDMMSSGSRWVGTGPEYDSMAPELSGAAAASGAASGITLGPGAGAGAAADTSMLPYTTLVMSTGPLYAVTL